MEACNELGSFFTKRAHHTVALTSLCCVARAVLTDRSMSEDAPETSSAVGSENQALEAKLSEDAIGNPILIVIVILMRS